MKYVETIAELRSPSLVDRADSNGSVSVEVNKNTSTLERQENKEEV
jgi:hypothetical protein